MTLTDLLVPTWRQMLGALADWLAKAEVLPSACLSCLGETGLKHKSDAVRAACLGALFAIIEAGASKGAGGLAPALSKMVQGATKSNKEHGDGIAAEYIASKLPKNEVVER